MCASSRVKGDMLHSPGYIRQGHIARPTRPAVARTHGTAGTMGREVESDGCLVGQRLARLDFAIFIRRRVAEQRAEHVGVRVGFRR